PAPFKSTAWKDAVPRLFRGTKGKKYNPRAKSWRGGHLPQTTSPIKRQAQWWCPQWWSPRWWFPPWWSPQQGSPRWWSPRWWFPPWWFPPWWSPLQPRWAREWRRAGWYWSTQPGRKQEPRPSSKRLFFSWYKHLLTPSYSIRPML